VSRRRAWLTPDSPAPETTRCRTISIPDDLLLIGAVTGALLPLTQAENWEEFGSMSSQEAADIMSASFEDFVASDCEGTCPPPNVAGVRIIRISPTTGKYEELADDSETWQEPTGDYAVPAIGERSEPTEDERKCAAAANAVNVMHELYNETLALWDDAVAPLAAFEAFGELAGELANSVLSLLLGAFAPFVGTGWGLFYGTMEILTLDTWTEQFERDFTCLLKDNTSYTSGVVTFDYNAIMTGLFSAEILANTEILLLGQVSYLLGIIGADGLNLSGETTAVEGDCSNCDEWCYEFNYASTNGGLANVTVYDENGGVFCGAGGGGVYTSGTWWAIGKAIGRTFSRRLITHVEADWNVVSIPAGQGPGLACEFYDPQGNRSYDRDYGTFTAANSSTAGTGTSTWDGEEWASEFAFLRCTTSGGTGITRLLIRGRGENPFGTDNCS